MNPNHAVLSNKYQLKDKKRVMQAFQNSTLDSQGFLELQQGIVFKPLKSNLFSNFLSKKDRENI